ncbi:MAG: hypothetical protein ACOCXJ_07945 [Planctomycetota bacterium]
MDKLLVDCTRLGLGESEGVTVIWNGEEVYSGEPGELKLPEDFTVGERLFELD